MQWKGADFVAVVINTRKLPESSVASCPVWISLGCLLENSRRRKSHSPPVQIEHHGKDYGLEPHQARPQLQSKSERNLYLVLSSSKPIRLFVIISPHSTPTASTTRLSATRQLAWRRILNLLFVPGLLLMLEYRTKHSDYCLARLTWGHWKDKKPCKDAELLSEGSSH